MTAPLPRARIRIAAIPATLFLALLPPTAPAAPPDHLPAPLRSFLRSHCYECHDSDTAKGDLNLENLPADLTAADPMRSWVAVQDRLANHEMPPEDADQPSPADRQLALDSLATLLTEAHRSQREVVLRRLNRIEFEHTVRDLFGIEVFLQDLLPEDASAHGFDNIGAALSISTEQMQAYLEAADTVLDEVFGPPEEPRRVKVTVNLRDFIEEPDGERSVRLTPEGVVLFNSGYNPSVVRNFDNPSPGRYRVRILARAVQSQLPVTMLVYGGVWGLRDKHIAGFFEIPPGDPTTIELVDRLWEPNDTFEIYPFDTIHRQTEPDRYDGPGLFVGDVTIEGPLGAWPPESRLAILAGADPEAGSPADAERILRTFLPRAFRRPIHPDDLDPLLALIADRLQAGHPFAAALRTGLKAALCSPAFLFLEEGRAAPLPDHALASRLSYFLWSSAPDPELLGLASDGRLRDPDTLRAQTERLLNDPRASRFTTNFTGQWLRLREIDSTLPDEKLYPDYDELLKRSMLAESHRFFEHLLAADLDIATFLHADFTFLNERLARHYGIPGINGLDLRRVTLPPDHVRGGILTQAAVLKVTANGTTTSPVPRGAWVLANILGRPSQPPPPGTPAVEPDIRGATTIREQLDKHRDVPSCARCHRHLDPPGFALENFDVIGGWRDHYRSVESGQWIERDPRYPHRHVQYRQGPAVDASGRTPDGTTFRDIRDYKRHLLAHRDHFARCLTEKLLTYALGRGLGFSDRPQIDAIVLQLNEHGSGLRTLLHEIVQSDSFASP